VITSWGPQYALNQLEIDPNTMGILHRRQLTGVLLQGHHDRRPDGEVRHEVSVHDVDVQPVGLGRDLADRRGQVPEAGRQERGSEGARERGSEGARERGSEGARERGSEGARERPGTSRVRLA